MIRSDKHHKGSKNSICCIKPYQTFESKKHAFQNRLKMTVDNTFLKVKLSLRVVHKLCRLDRGGGGGHIAPKTIY